MPTRETDHAQSSAQQVFTFDRKIPVTWLFGVAGALTLSIAGMWYQLQRTAERTAETSIEVKAIREDIAKQTRKAIDDDYAMRDVQRRVTVIEATLQAQRDQQQKAAK